MQRLPFTDAEQIHKKRKTRRERFLERMDKLMPWTKLEALIQPFYYQNTTGRPAYPLASMLRIHAMQLFYNLSDPAMKDALYEIDSMRRFADLDLTRNLPDETTILKFRHLLEKHGLAKEIFNCVNDELQQQGLILKQGTLVDASILSAPSSTKNKSGQRDPEMHQAKKGNQWHFGIKMHIGADDISGAVYSLETTAANVHDVTAADQLLHGEETRVWSDAGYRGINKRDEHKNRQVGWFIAMRPGQRKKLASDDPREKIEQQKSAIRSLVEHPFRYVKQVFSYSKTRYRGLKKNPDRIYMLLAFSNLLITEKHRPA